MRAVTWNVWWRFGGDWQARQRAIVATLERLRPDVVGLQEAWAGGGTSQPECLARELSMQFAVARPSPPPPPEPPEAPDQAGIEVAVGLLTRWPVLCVREPRLPAVHRDPPVALVATLDHPGGPLHVVVSCVEWEPRFADDHLAQTRALAALLDDPCLDGALPVLLAADLNAAPGEPLLQPLMDVAVDAWAAVRSDEAATLSSDNPLVAAAEQARVDERIDYVLARPPRGKDVEVERAFVVDEAVDGVVPSDHFPVVVDLRP